MDKQLLKDLRDDPEFNPLTTSEAHTDAHPQWLELCEATLRELEEVDVESKPPTERELFGYQHDFYAHQGDQDAIRDMFKTLASYSGSLILKVKKSTRYLNKSQLKDMSQEVALRVVSQYLKRPGFIINGSFAGYIKWKILEVTGEADDFERAEQIDPITKKKKKMPLLSLNNLVDKARGQETSIEDLQESLNFVNMGAPTTTGLVTNDLRAQESIDGIMRIVSTTLQFIDEKALNNSRSFRDRLYVVTALHTLFDSGLPSYEKYQRHAPNTKIMRLLEMTSAEIIQLLRSSSGGDEDY